MATPNPSINQDRRMMRDVTIFSLTIENEQGTPTPIDCIGIVHTVEIRLVREFVDVTAAGDIATTSRAIRWGRGSVRLSGFSTGTSSKFAGLYATGSHALLQFVESSGGDSYALLCGLQELAKSLGDSITRDSLTLSVEGVPYYQPGGATVLAAMVLE